MRNARRDNLPKCGNAFPSHDRKGVVTSRLPLHSSRAVFKSRRKSQEGGFALLLIFLLAACIGIYLYMQSPLGRGAGAALGVVAILLVSMGTYLIHRIFGGRTGSAFRI